jgi:hypothetical protein
MKKRPLVVVSDVVDNNMLTITILDEPNMSHSCAKENVPKRVIKSRGGGEEMTIKI